mgnify:CR=1 FL=1
MKKKNIVVLDKLYQRIIELQTRLEETTDEKKKADLMAELCELIRMANSMEDKIHKHDFSEDIKFGINSAINLAGIVLPLMFYNKLFEEGLRYEETGIFTATTFKNLLSKIKPN